MKSRRNRKENSIARWKRLVDKLFSFGIDSLVCSEQKGKRKKYFRFHVAETISFPTLPRCPTLNYTSVFNRFRDLINNVERSGTFTVSDIEFNQISLGESNVRSWAGYVLSSSWRIIGGKHGAEGCLEYSRVVEEEEGGMRFRKSLNCLGWLAGESVFRVSFSAYTCRMVRGGWARSMRARATLIVAAILGHTSHIPTILGFMRRA